MNKIILLNLLLITFFFSACAARNPSNVQPQRTEQQIQAVQELEELNSKILIQGVSAPVSPADYVVGPADLLEVKIFEAERLSDSVRVSSTGKITLPLLGSIDVSGLTARETEIKIENLFKERGYIREPHVSVFVEEYKSKQVSVIGAVNAPGTYELLGRQTLLEALALSQGLSPDAGRSAYITRIQGEGERQSFVVDVDNLIVNNNPELNIPIEPGDII
ncbi:MAG: polysaccharide biosynthesis/export family protein, partial [Thermodesulfobacteriota bacterium]